MAENVMQRKLKAIFSADVKGYSKLMGDDDESTVSTITTYREIIAGLIKKHNGRVVDAPGDNILAEFSSALDAVNSAIEIQGKLETENAKLLENRRMEFRIGINLGDILHKEDRIYGDGVNVAARIESLADPGGICISRGVFDQVKKKVRQGFEYLGEHVVKNISEPVRIYRILLSTEYEGRVIAEPPSKLTIKKSTVAIMGLVLLISAALVWMLYPRALEIEPASIEKMALPLPDNPSIAVLPFHNLSGDKEQDPIADGLTEDIITSLSRVPDLFVIARNSTFTYKGKPAKARQVAEELGVRYVLEGSVQRSGENLRITAQLIDALKGRHLWAHRYDRRAENLFAMQDEITREVLIELQVKLISGDHARAASQGTESLEAWLLYNQARAHALKVTRESHLKGREIYEKATEIDPNYARAWAGIGYTYYMEARQGGWVVSREEALTKCFELAKHAIEIGPQQPLGYQVMANIYLLKGEHERAVALAEKSADLAPNSFQAISVVAWQYFWADDVERSLDAFARLKRVSPRYSAWIPGVEGAALHFAGRHDDAIVTLKEAIKRQPTNFFAHARLIAVYVDSDRMEEAKSAAAKLLETRPKFTVGSFMKTQPFKNKERKEWFRGLLLKAGLPEKPVN